MRKKVRQEQVGIQVFIQNTLVQIINGVKEAQDSIGYSGATICPTGLYFTGGQETCVIYKPGWGIVQTVEFDIAVGTSGSIEAQGGAGISVNVINLGAKAVKGKKKEAMNRVRFSVPVLLPSKFYDWQKEGKADMEGKI